MLFNSLEFLLFFPLVTLLFYAIPHSSFRIPFLLAASYLFYMWWRPAYILLILASTGIDYCAGLWLPKMSNPRRKKILFVTSIVGNLGLLGVFKYFNFSVHTLNALMNWAGLPPLAAHADWVLPVGISFYTFQSMSYTIDVYRGQIEPERNPIRFALYVAYFPQLVAGPIERGNHLLPQLKKPQPPTSARFQEGLLLIIWGLYKKMVIADGLARLVDPVYARPEAYGGPAYFIATYAFAFQILTDFSGYTDIARGTAMILGIDLMENFEKPYFAVSIQDFWRRWHISLSSWLKDYLYISLGGNRKGTAKTYRNLLLTMALGGLWHGASWNFVIWGLFHGALLAIERAMRAPRASRDCESTGWRRLLRQIATFHLVCVGWVFFRAADLKTAIHILKGSILWEDNLHIPYLGTAEAMIIISTLVFLFAEALAGPKSTLTWLQQQSRRPLLGLILIWVFFALALFSAGTGHQFIYFQF